MKFEAFFYSKVNKHLGNEFHGSAQKNMCSLVVVRKVSRAGIYAGATTLATRVDKGSFTHSTGDKILLFVTFLRFVKFWVE